MTRKMEFLDKQEQSARKIMGVGIGVSLGFAPQVGIPIAIPGILKALGENAARRDLRKQLIRKPKAARLLAKKFQGTKHERFFVKAADAAEKRRKKEIEKKKGF